MPKRLLIEEFIENRVWVSSSQTIHDIIALMKENELNAIAVVDGQKAVGIITERDILRLTSNHTIFSEHKALDIMSKPVHTIHKHQDYQDAYIKMSRLGIRHLIVLNDKDEYLGLISEDELFSKLEYNQFLSHKSIEELMCKNVVSVEHSTPLQEALSTMSAQNISSIVVLDGQDAVGILTEKDVITLLHNGIEILEQPISNYMSSPVKRITQNHTLIEVEELMKDHQFRHMVVVNEKSELVGVLSQHDLIKGIPTAYINYLKRSLKTKELKLEALNDQLFYDYALNSLSDYFIMVIDKDQNIYYLNNQTVPRACGLELEVNSSMNELLDHQLFEVIRNNIDKPARAYCEVSVEVKKREQQHFSTEFLPIFEDKVFTGYVFIAHNITSSIENKRVVQEEKAQLNLAQKLARLCNWELNMSTREFECSSFLYELLHIHPFTKVNLDLLKSRISSSSYQQLKEAAKKCLSTKEDQYIVFELLDFTQKEILVSANISFNPASKSSALIGTLQDITIRKKREDEIARFQQIVSSINDKVVFLDKEYNYLFANKAYLDFFNISEYKLYRSNLSEIVGEEWFYKDFKGRIDRVFEGEVLKFDRVYPSKEGDITLKVSYYPYYNEESKITGLVGILQDVTSEKRSLKNLEYSEQRYRTLFEDSKAIMLLIDPKSSEIRHANRAAVEFYGYEKKKLEALKIADINILSEERLCSELEKAKADKKATFNFKHKLANGEIRDVEVQSSSIILDGDSLLFSIITDVTVKHKTQQQLKLWASVIQNTNEGVVITDDQNKILDINPAFTKITGYTLEEVKGLMPNFLASGRHDTNFYARMWNSIKKHNSWQGELWNKKKDGTVYPEWLNINRVVDKENNVTNYVAVFSDITLIKKSEDNLFHMAHHDVLTNLPNRLMLKSQVDYLIKNSKRNEHKFAVLFLDLDNFKLVNDTMGHSHGDEVIQNIATTFKGHIRENDMIARVGGDEFIIVLDNIHDQFDIERVCEKLIDHFKTPIPVGDREFNMGVSIGVSLYPENGEDVESLIKNADAAMYHSKNSGKNTFRYYSEEMTLNMVNKLKMDTELRNAIAHNQFVLHYQPLVDLKTQKIFSLEVLLRWNHPTRGLLAPNEFMDHLEESKLIVPLGDEILLKACMQLKLWHDMKVFNGSISVNISALQIEHGDLLCSVKKAIEQSGLEPEFLALELTETYLMKNAKKSFDILKQLKELGINLAIDDFGTGYSSFYYLKQFPVDRLKIDLSFIRNITEDNSDEKIVKTIIDLGHNMNMNVIAEGIETKEQMNILMDNNCQEGQGYLFAKPLSQEAFEKWYTSQNN